MGEEDKSEAEVGDRAGEAEEALEGGGVEGTLSRGAGDGVEGGTRE